MRIQRNRTVFYKPTTSRIGRVFSENTEQQKLPSIHNAINQWFAQPPRRAINRTLPSQFFDGCVEYAKEIPSALLALQEQIKLSPPINWDAPCATNVVAGSYLHDQPEPTVHRLVLELAFLDALRTFDVKQGLAPLEEPLQAWTQAEGIYQEVQRSRPDHAAIQDYELLERHYGLLQTEGAVDFMAQVEAVKIALDAISKQIKPRSRSARSFDYILRRASFSEAEPNAGLLRALRGVLPEFDDAFLSFAQQIDALSLVAQRRAAILEGYPKAKADHDARKQAWQNAYENETQAKKRYTTTLAAALKPLYDAAEKTLQDARKKNGGPGREDGLFQALFSNFGPRGLGQRMDPEVCHNLRGLRIAEKYLRGGD